MKTFTKNTFVCALALVAMQLTVSRSLAQFPAGPGQETTSSLGLFRIVVNPTFQGMMAGYPGFDASFRLTSPVLNDYSTLIGRSAVHQHGDAQDTGGLPVGAAGTIISDGNFTEQPAGFQGPTYTREVHTEIRMLNMTDGAGTAVRAGTAAPGAPISPGEVQSRSGASGNPALDFPASSFFDIFVEVDLPAGGTFLGATLYNDQALLVRNTNLTSFPPPVVYIHESSAAVPIRFKTTGPGPWIAGDLFGLLLLGGHALASNDTASVAAFTATVLGSPELPVSPQYTNWAPGLTVVSNTFPGLGDDNTYSLGSFTVVVNPAYQAAFAVGPYPGYNPVTKRLVSPTLFDAATVIGRSAPTNDASPGDIAGVTCGTVNPLIIGNSSYALFPSSFNGPAGTRQVMTKITSLNMSLGGSAPRVRAGTAAPGRPPSFGQVESLSANSGNTNIDFPAESFFDIFVEVDLPAFGAIPPFTVTNKEPLIVHDNEVKNFPPKVIYIHGNSTAVPVLFTSPGPGWVAGDTFGILTLAGHGISYRKDAGTGSDQQEFEQTMQQEPEMRVEPKHATWAPGLVVAPTRPTISSLSITNGGLIVIKGGGMPFTPYYLTRTFQLGQGANWQTNAGPIQSDQSGNFQINTTSPSPQAYYRIAGPPLPQ